MLKTASTLTIAAAVAMMMSLGAAQADDMKKDTMMKKDSMGGEMKSDKMMKKDSMGGAMKDKHAMDDKMKKDDMMEKKDKMMGDKK
ncbi:MAG: hypothetical protein O2967_15725 [Proteobacteria bacterium]|nr:hypothetical protein [Pseudomonadota bacterium]